MESTTQKTRVVLPKDAKPKKYTITITPDLTNFTFSGKEDILLDILSPTSTLTLNAVDLTISSASFTPSSSPSPLPSSSTSLSPSPAETLSITFPSPLPQGEGTLSLSFSGKLSDSLKGFYRSKVVSPSGEISYMAVTQFEPTDARRAIPCWDEPNLKAKFDLTLIVPKDLTAISNMPIVEEISLENNLRQVHFGETPKMSTYLLAMIIGNFDFLESKTPDGVTIRVYTPVGKKSQGKFALDVAVKTLPFYNSYFGIPFPLPKCDLIAIPDFAAGAMENWGCVTYRETALLVDPEISSASTRQWVALVVGHELAHMWFGNYCTMDWWTHLWLNEGFASWIEYLCVDHCFPEWDIWTQFVNVDLERALSLDALKSTHPIEVEVGHPSEIDEIFDTISYSKGSSVIRMLYGYLGEISFKKGLYAYLSKHAYSNAFTEDLWEALGTASGKPVKELMDGWTKQPGFPVLEVKEISEGKLEISQKKFLATGHDPSDVTTWWVPVGILSEKGTENFVLQEKSTVVSKPSSGWIKLNPSQSGFYRVKYSSALLQNLLEPIQKLSLLPADRLGIVSDVFSLAKAGEVKTVDALKVLEGYENEENYTVWASIASNLKDLERILAGTPVFPKFLAFVRKLFSKIAKSLGWEATSGESHLRALLRSLVLGKLAGCDDADTISEAQKRFAQFMSNPSSLTPDLRSTVYRTVLASGNAETFEQVLKVFRGTDLHEEKERCMRSLGSVKSKELLLKTLDFAMSDEVRDQDKVFVIATVAYNPLGRDLAWEFIQSNWEKLYEKFSGGFLLSRLVSYTGEFTTEAKAKEIEAFFEKHKAPAAERAVMQAVENIRSNARWIERDGAEVSKWLEEKY